MGPLVGTKPLWMILPQTDYVVVESVILFDFPEIQQDGFEGDDEDSAEGCGQIDPTPIGEVIREVRIGSGAKKPFGPVAHNRKDVGFPGSVSPKWHVDCREKRVLHQIALGRPQAI